MKSQSPRGEPFANEFHQFLVNEFGGYTAASGNITGYWVRPKGREECNEHREYQIAISSEQELNTLTGHLSGLASALGEQTIFCTVQGVAFLIAASKLGTSSRSSRKARRK